jgi:uncharacterized protein (TIGR03435 family)
MMRLWRGTSATRVLFFLLAAWFGLAARTSVAQPATAPGTPLATSPAPAPAFDVAAIRLHESQPHEHNSIWSSPFDGNFNAENISVIALINWAYEMPDTRIIGAPSWAGTTMFNIEAKSGPEVDQQMHNLPSDAGRKQKEQMVQALLADRFGLKVHFETRELPVYNLVVAKGGAKLGPLQDSGSHINTWNNRIEVEMADSIPYFAAELSKVAGRDVIDKTGITGRYDIKLRFTPDDGPSMLNGQPIPDPPPALFTALEEELGLKLEPGKGPVEVLVIDHIEMPSEN